MWYNNVLEIIGNTPLVKINKITEGLKPTILAKLEFLNPGGSVKDRMAYLILKEAEKEGKLKKGGTIVEATSGNTGIACCMYAAVKGYKIIITIPDKMSEEKINLLKALGAKVIVCPTEVPEDSPEHYVQVAKRIVNETPNSFMVNQYHNLRNVDAHYYTTGPEIWEQTNGKVDYVVGGLGTGGTISGTGKYLKEKNKEIKIIGVDPVGSVYYNYFKEKRICEHKPYLLEGIGMEFICPTLLFEYIDDIIQVSDKDAFIMARKLVKYEGILAGGSSGAAVFGAIELAKKVDKEAVIVVILPDGSRAYISKIFNDEWIKENFSDWEDIIKA